MTRIRNCFNRSFIYFAALFVCSFGFEAAAQGLPGRGAGIGLRSSREATSSVRGPIRGEAYTGGYNGALFNSPWLLPGWGWNIPQGYLAQSYPAYGGYRGMGFLPPVAIEPRLGLQHSYPFSWQMGIQMPVDASPLATPSLGPFEGVVRSQERAARLGSPAARNGVALLRKGKYRDAGLLLAGAYRDSDDPIHPLLLAEALFGLGKYQHAELVLRKALESEGAFAVLPEDVAGHFPRRKLSRTVSPSSPAAASTSSSAPTCLSSPKMDPPESRPCSPWRRRMSSLPDSIAIISTGSSEPQNPRPKLPRRAPKRNRSSRR